MDQPPCIFCRLREVCNDGTSGFEATFYEKPSLTLADVGYSMLPSVSRVKELDRLPQYISNSIKQKVKASDLDKFLVLLEKNSINFDLFINSIAEA